MPPMPRLISLSLALFLLGCGSGGDNNASAPPVSLPPSSPTPRPAPTPPPTAGCTIQYQNQTCTAGVLITPVSSPPPPAPPLLPGFTNAAQWETAEYARNFGLDQIGASLAYAKGAFGQGVKIAIIDVGNQSNHPEVFGRVDPASTSIYAERGDIVEGDNRWAHGLQVASLAMGTRNDTGAHGVAPAAELLYIRVDAGFSFPSVDGFPLHTPQDIAQSIDYATAHGATIISMSVGVASDPSRVLFDAIRRATDQGVVVITALGNYFDGRPDNQKTITLFPGAYGGDPAFRRRLVLAGASDASGNIGFFSPRAGNRGEAFLLAPGADMLVPGGGGSRSIILAPGNTTSYLRDSGTSFAAPHIAGALALLMSSDPGLDAVAALDLLYANAVDVGPTGIDQTNGAGRIDLHAIFR